MTPEEKQYLDERFNTVKQQISASHKLDEQKHIHVHMTLEEIKQSIERTYHEQRKTNGRVTKLEKDTTAARFLQRKPLVGIGIVLIIILLANLLTKDEIIGLIFKSVAI